MKGQKRGIRKTFWRRKKDSTVSLKTAAAKAAAVIDLLPLFFPVTITSLAAVIALAGAVAILPGAVPIIRLIHPQCILQLIPELLCRLLAGYLPVGRHNAVFYSKSDDKIENRGTYTYNVQPCHKFIHISPSQQPAFCSFDSLIHCTICALREWYNVRMAAGRALNRCIIAAPRLLYHECKARMV